MIQTSRAKDRLRHVVVSVFFTFHCLAVTWWLIPADGYPKEERKQSLPSWFERGEETVFHWKQKSLGSAWSRTLNGYLHLTATWQKWWMFAPNPINTHQWISVHAITAWNDPPSGYPVPPSGRYPWGDLRLPVYDPETLFQTYPGSSVTEQFGHGIGFLYSRNHTVSDYLGSGNYNRVFPGFVAYWARQYKNKHGTYPKGFHVVLHRGWIPRPFSNRTLASVLLKEEVVWFVHE